MIEIRKLKILRQPPIINYQININLRIMLNFDSLYYEKNSEKFEDKSYLDKISKLLKRKKGL